MPIDPRRVAMTPEGATADRLADLERSVRGLQGGSLNRTVATASVDTSGSFTVVNNVGGIVDTFGSVSWDVGDMFDPSAPDRLTFPVPGVYLVVAGGQFPATGGSGFRSVSLSGSFIDLPNARAGDSIYPGTTTVDLWLTSMVLAAEAELSYVQLFAFISASSNTTFSGTLSAAYIGNHEF